jgi:protease-4
MTYPRLFGLLMPMLALMSPALVAAAAPATRPVTTTTTATRPAAAAALDAKNLAEQIMRRKEERAAQAKVAHFDLTDEILDRPLSFTLFPKPDDSSLWSLIDRLKRAGDDSEVKAVLITLRGAQFSLAQAVEVRNVLRQIGRSGKPTFVYADTYDTSSYVLASGASDICLLSGGDIVMPGIGLQVLFARGLLDKIGVQADFVQVGEYKGADEALTRTAGSEQLRGELNRLADAMYGQLVQLVADGRGLSPKTVRGIIDEAIVRAARAKEYKLVDHLCDVDDLRDLMGRKLDKKVELVRDYGLAEESGLDLSNPFGLLSLLARRSPPQTAPAVGVLYVTGMIVDGDGEDSLFESEESADGMVRRGMRKALRDDSIKAVVIRIDSPGGSALASEAGWQAIRRVAKEKPVVVSIGGMAASGGYYLASAGDYIFADSTAIVGSIGVVGGKIVMEKLLANIGVSSESFTRGANAELFSSTAPFSAGQRQMLRKWMEQTYDQFLERVLTTRRGKIAEIDKVARGRVFLAPRGLELGMIDALGGLDDAIVYAADKARLDKSAYEVRALPAPRTLGDLLASKGDVRSPLNATRGLAAAQQAGQLSPLQAQLALLPPGARRAIMRQVTLARLLERRQVALVLPWLLSE